MAKLRIALAFAVASLAAALPQEEPRAAGVIALAAEEPEREGAGFDGGLLIRELMRQAVLIAGREELGLPTRDQALREIGPDAKEALGIQTLAVPGRSVRVRLTRGVGEARKAIWEKSIPLPAGPNVDYLKLATLAEALSRGELVGALKQAGFSGTAVASWPAQPAPPAAERRLLDLTFIEPYIALRELHEACRTSGESPARLGAIVRGYANLGQLTQGFWNATPKVFAARSLLYAERLSAAAPGSRLARWHRAYARTFAGLHKAALEDLAEAAKIADDKGDAPPVWVSWLETCSKYETPKIEGSTLVEFRPLQTFLAYLTLERCGSPSYERERALAAIQANPGCYRLYDALCQIGGITNLHEATEAGPRAIGSQIYPRLQGLPALPKRVKDAISTLDAAPSEPAARARVWKALLASSEPVEPSWPLLGRLIEETSFVQTFRRGEFMRYHWSVPVDEFLQDTAPLVADHPYRAIIRSFGLDVRRQPQEWSAAFRTTNLVDGNDSCVPIINATWNLTAVDRLIGKKAWEAVALHRDAIAPDLELIVHHTPAKESEARSKAAADLIEVSPYSPLGIAELVGSDWPKLESRAAELEKTLGHHPRVLHALGMRYRALKQDEDAERCLTREAAIAPSLAASRSLALLYLDRGDEDKWLVTLEKFLTTEDVGLDHANVRVELARHFMQLGKWDKAQPYAEGAAETWAAWAMECARDCAEGKGDWEKAELWQQRVSDRYDGEQMEWFFWCKRNQKGSVKGAQALAGEYIAKLLPRATAQDHQKIGIFYALTGKPREALASFQKAQEETSNPYDGLHAALLAMELKDGEARDAALLNVIQKGASFKQEGKPRALEIRLATEFRELLSKGAGARPDPGVFSQLVEDAPDAASRANATYFIGRFLDLQVGPGEGKPYYARCVEQGVKFGQIRRWNYLLALEAQRAAK